MNVHPASLRDLAEMNRIAVEAKAHWGYSSDQLARWAPDLSTTPETIASWPTVVAETDGCLAGFAQIDPTVSPWELVSLWVKPEFIRQGIGTSLLRHMQSVASDSGMPEIHIDSDPNALLFYKACGATEVGTVAAQIEAHQDRVRPQLRLQTRGA
jgi:N-acetylglutamate synthase-like GNAT family acetyltransferase